MEEFKNFILHFMVASFKIRFVWLAQTRSNPIPLVTSKNVYCQPQKRICEVCCLRARIHVVTWIELLYDYVVAQPRNQRPPPIHVNIEQIYKILMNARRLSSV